MGDLTYVICRFVGGLAMSYATVGVGSRGRFAHRHHRVKKASQYVEVPVRAPQDAAEDIAYEPQYTVQTAGAWSPWAADLKGREFYYRSRVGINGQWEYDFASERPFQPTHIPTDTPIYQTNYPLQPIPAPVQQAPAEHIQYTRKFYRREDRPSSESTLSHSSSDQNFEARPKRSGYTIPAIIDLDLDDNLKIMVPNGRGSQTSLVWNRKSRHSGSRTSPGYRVREWLQSEFET
ncbi:hypothetical protein CPLU01_03252 [Colletotrichum plurivorum]|uniref:Uncharacterized protein n=1 Tax=Colletotrichum plurivorum TaxID=2175906 RepID=A0A8H6NLL4_9PEZI|nr:hypothetical protein CPLU01_03252 [Colletotrichum plurivorum]